MPIIRLKILYLHLENVFLIKYEYILLYSFFSLFLFQNVEQPLGHI